MDDVKLFVKNKNKLETLIHIVSFVKTAMEFKIETCAMIKKGKTTEKMEFPNQESIKMFREKER